MRVRVKKNRGPAYINGRRYREGEIVVLEGVTRLPLWAEAVDADAVAAKAEAVDAKPITLRDVAKAGAGVEFVGDTKPAKPAAKSAAKVEVGQPVTLDKLNLKVEGKAEAKPDAEA